MDTGKVINKISNRLRRRSVALQEKLGMSGAQGTILNYILVDGSTEKSGSQGSHLPDQ